VTAGSYASPAILMQSGIGPAAALRDLGIGVAADLPGGRGQPDRPPAGCRRPARRARLCRAPLPGDDHPSLALADPGGPPDLHLFTAGPFDDAASPAGGVFGLGAGLLAVRSRGSARLRSADPADPARIDIAHLRHPEDMTRMIEATRHARRSAVPRRSPGSSPAPSLHPVPRSATTTPPGWPARSANGPARTTTRWEPARWAPPRPRHRRQRPRAVHGIDRLSVADASVMPAIPAANTNLTTIVITERITHGLQARHQGFLVSPS
jgi:choline dehydrogenase-like flavoprotein